MTEALKQIIKEEVGKLSKDGQEAVNSLDWVQITEEIGQKYLLDESEIEDLQVQTLLVLLGLRNAGLYATAVENKIWTTNKDKAGKIADEVMQKIFIPMGNIIIEKIKKSGKHKNADAERNLNFILSGGDYSAFMAPARENSPLEEYPEVLPQGEVDIHPVSQASHPSRGEFPPRPDGHRGTLQEGNKPKKMEDLRSKFTI